MTFHSITVFRFTVLPFAKEWCHKFRKSLSKSRARKNGTRRTRQEPVTDRLPCSPCSVGGFGGCPPKKTEGCKVSGYSHHLYPKIKQKFMYIFQ
jgi:hypothetical protein